MIDCLKVIWLFVSFICMMVPTVRGDALQDVTDAVNSLDSTLRIVVICVAVVVVLTIIVLIIWFARKLVRCCFCSRSDARQKRLDVHSINALPVPSEQLMQERQRQSYMSSYAMQNPNASYQHNNNVNQNAMNYQYAGGNFNNASGVPVSALQPLAIDTRMGIVKDISDAPTVRGQNYEARLSQMPVPPPVAPVSSSYYKPLPDFGQQMSAGHEEMNNRDTVIFVDDMQDLNYFEGADASKRVVRSAGAIETISWDEYRNDMATGKYKIHQDDVVSYDL